MTSSSSNKQPVFVDRPLMSSVYVTETSGNATTINALPGDSPALIVDMDATLTSDNNSGGVIDSIKIVRHAVNYNDYAIETFTAALDANVKRLVRPGDIYRIDIAAAKTMTNAPFKDNPGFIIVNDDYVAATEQVFQSLTNTQATILKDVERNEDPHIVMIFYLTEGTTVPIPKENDYKPIFTKTLKAGEFQADCSIEMPHIIGPAVHTAGDLDSVEDGMPIRNRGIYLERGQRLYAAIHKKVNTNLRGADNTLAIQVTAQGGLY